MRLVRIGDNDFVSLWNDLLSDGDQLDALYGPSNLTFYREYYSSPETDDISLMVIDGTKPLCGLRATRRMLATGTIEISCFGLPLLYTESPRADTIALFRARRLIRTELEGILQTLPAETVIRYKDSLKGGCLSLLGRTLLDRGATVTPSFSQIIDLTLSEERLYKRLTKAFKWAVNWSKKNLSIQVIDQESITFEHVEQMRLLHCESAGRETRTLESWALQYDMVHAGEAFCVFAYLEGGLVSAALFPYSKSHCFYGVSASRRDLFDKPLSHGVIWSALMHAKQLSIRSFEMGEQLFPKTPRPNPSHKELGISFFKRAFGGEAKISLDICLCTPPNFTEITTNE
jgi:hypothetical protein